MKKVNHRISALTRKIWTYTRVRFTLTVLVLIVGLLAFLNSISTQHPWIVMTVSGFIVLGVYILHFNKVQEWNELLDPGYEEVYFERDGDGPPKKYITDYTFTRIRLHELSWWVNNGYRRTVSIETNQTGELDPKVFQVVESDGDFLGVVIGSDVVESELVDSDYFPPLFLQKIASARPETYLKRARYYSFCLVADVTILALIPLFIVASFASVGMLLLVPGAIITVLSLRYLDWRIWQLRQEYGDLVAAFFTSPERLREALEFYADVVDLKADLDLPVNARLDEFAGRFLQPHREGILTTRSVWERRLVQINRLEKWLPYLDRWPLAEDRSYYTGKDLRSRAMANYDDNYPELDPEEIWKICKLKDSKILFDKKEDVTPIPRKRKRKKVAKS